MRIRWRGLELPTSVTFEPESLTSTYGKLVAEPFERGFGTTVGNSLRRILLSSLEGAAVTSMKLNGALHEFTTMPGALEDVTDIVLNVKGILVRMHNDQPKSLTLKVKRKGPVTAGDIQTDPTVEVVNPDHHLLTLAEERGLEMEFAVRTGRGYVTAEELAPVQKETGVIPVDASFSPVRRVRYRTEDTRVGKITNYDRLIMEIWTNGVLGPEMALVEAAKILRKHLNPFVQYFELGRELERVRQCQGERLDELRKRQDLTEKLQMSVSELDLSVRASNCLNAANIRTIGELVSHQESEMLKIRNFGKTSLEEIKGKLVSLELSFGMAVEQPVAKQEGP
jgi:DNA-directed RNA polymerase subunit alpha